MDKPDQQIPREILESEYKHSLPPRPERPGILGLPPIPDDLLDITIKYLPWLVLAAAFTNGMGAIGILIGASSYLAVGGNSAAAFGAVVSLLASVVGVAAFFWLSDKRELGWNLLVGAVVLHLLSGMFVAGIAGLLPTIIGVVVAVYILNQIRSSYSD